MNIPNNCMFHLPSRNQHCLSWVSLLFIMSIFSSVQRKCVQIPAESNQRLLKKGLVLPCLALCIKKAWTKASSWIADYTYILPQECTLSHEVPGSEVKS